MFVVVEARFLTKGPNSRISLTIRKDEKERKWKEELAQWANMTGMTANRPLSTTRGKSKVNGL